ncbi:hypothetical protein A2U01_0052616, partial [Trifolium medium]|nr:hypothetical protein [Trifolium medium]
TNLVPTPYIIRIPTGYSVRPAETNVVV